MSRDALVVGINAYNLPFLKNLNAPAADAEAIAQRLEQYGEFKVTRLPAVKDKQNNTIRIGQQTKVTLTQLKKSIVQLFKPEGRHISDTALLYFSGHGLREELGISEGFLATSDVNPEDGKSGLSLQWLRRLLLESEVRQQIIILDCCYSGQMLNFAEADPGDRGKGRDRCFIAASRAYEVAYEEIDSNHSVLTSALLKGLEPKQEQWVTNYDLIVFINQQENSFPQHPIFANSGEVINLTRKRTLNTLDSTAKSEQAICPYKGLAYFDCTEEDAKYFYGRTALTDQLLEKVRTSNFLAILGASGSGKSSVVRAGLLYQLKLGQRLSGSNNWQIRILKPAEHPLQSLALAFTDPGLSYIDGYAQVEKTKQLIAANGAVALENLIKDADTERVVLVVDQFEEAFTLCQDIKERQQFFECLLGAVRKISNKLCLVLTMRSDFFGKCTEQDYSGLAQEIQQSLVTVTPMTEEELRQVIVQPARQVNLEIEPELVEQILKDVTNAPGYLPLLEYTLTEMWKQRTDNCLRLNNYAKLGGVTGTLRQRATEVYESFSDETQKSAVRHIFLSLTQLGEGTEDTRRRVCKQDLVNKKYSEELINQVVQRLADEKLIVTERVEKSGISGRVAVVDVAHEALIRYWLRLREWVDKNRDALKIERKIQAAAEEWEKQGKSTDYLFKGLQLAQAEKLIKDDINTVVLSPLALEFVQASQQEHNRLEKEMQGQKLSTISILTTSSQELFDSNKEFDALLASLNAAKEMKQAAFEIPSDIQFRVKVALQQSIYWVKERNRLEGHKAGVHSVSYSPDGKTLASASRDKTIKLWNVATGKEISTLTDEDAVAVVSFSPDGKTLASASGDKTIKLWDVATGNKINKIFTFSGYEVSYGENGVSFSPNGQLLAFTSERYTIQVWDVASRQKIATFSGHRDQVKGVSFSPNGRLLASASFDGTVKLWDVTTHKEISTNIQYDVFMGDVSFSPDGQLLAVGGDVGIVKLWDVATRKEIPTNFSGFKGRVLNISFSPNGQLLAASGINNAIKLWDVATGKEISTLTGHRADVTGAKFSPDGQWLASPSIDHSIKLWYIGQRQEIKTLSGHIDHVNSVSFSPHGRLLASASHDNTVKLWDVATGQEIKTLEGHEHWVLSVSFSPDGKYLVSGSQDNTIKLWNVTISQEIKTFKGHELWVDSVSFSPDGKYFASGSCDNTVKLWDVATGQEIKTLKGHNDFVKSVSFSPNGQLLVSASRDQTIKLWDIATGRALNTLTGHEDEITSVSFSPDGRLLASAADRTIKLWDVATGIKLDTLIGHKVRVNSISFSSDGQLLTSASNDHTIILWDVTTHKEINIFNAKTEVYSISFSPDGQLLASGGQSGTVILWNLKVLSDLTLEELLVRGCDWVCSYLQTNPNVSNSDKQLCNDIGIAKSVD